MKYQSLFKDLRYILFSFKGRISRSEWWFYVLLRTVVLLIPAVILIKSGRGRIPNVYALTSLTAFYGFIQHDLLSAAGGTFHGSLLLTIFLIYFDTAAFIKRLHDINLWGWFVLLGYVPILGPPCLLILCGFIKGTQGDNQYGEIPYGNVREDQPTPQVEG